MPNKGFWRAWFDVLCVSIQWGWRVHSRDPPPPHDLCTGVLEIVDGVLYFCLGTTTALFSMS